MTKYTHSDCPSLLPVWVTVTISNVNGTKEVTINSSIHISKQYKLPNSWSDTFSDYEILRDYKFLEHLGRFR